MIARGPEALGHSAKVRAGIASRPSPGHRRAGALRQWPAGRREKHPVQLALPVGVDLRLGGLVKTMFARGSPRGARWRTNKSRRRNPTWRCQLDRQRAWKWRWLPATRRARPGPVSATDRLWVLSTATPEV